MSQQTGKMTTTRVAIPWVLLLLHLLLLLTTSLALFGVAESKFPAKDTVDIVNRMSGSITVHCKSRDDDLGVHILAPDQKYNFKFHRNFWGTTLFWCAFTSPTGQQKSLEVWSATVMKHSRCYGKCYWYVRQDGFWVTDYNYKYEPLSEKFMVPW